MSPLSSGSVVEVRVEDATRTGTLTPAALLGSTRFEAAGQVPIPFEVDLPEGGTGRRAAYAVSARIYGPDGRLLFASDAPHRLSAAASTDRVELVIVPSGRRGEGTWPWRRAACRLTSWRGGMGERVRWVALAPLGPATASETRTGGPMYGQYWPNRRRDDRSSDGAAGGRCGALGSRGHRGVHRRGLPSAPRRSVRRGHRRRALPPFNAADLPVGGFVRRVVLGDPEEQVVLGPEARSSRAALPYLAALLVELLSGPAPPAEAELAALDGPGGRTLRAGPPGPSSEADTERVRRALKAVLDPAPTRRAELAPSTGSRRRSGGAQPWPALSPRRPTYLRGDRPTARGDPYEAMARGLLAGRGTVSRYVQWALWLTRSRQEIVERAVSLYGGLKASAVHAGTDRLLALARGRAEAWFGPRGPDSGDGAVQRLPLGTVVHCFAP